MEQRPRGGWRDVLFPPCGLGLVRALEGGRDSIRANSETCTPCPHPCPGGDAKGPGVSLQGQNLGHNSQEGCGEKGSWWAWPPGFSLSLCVSLCVTLSLSCSLSRSLSSFPISFHKKSNCLNHPKQTSCCSRLCFLKPGLLGKGLGSPASVWPACGGVSGPPPARSPAPPALPGPVLLMSPRRHQS